MAGFVDDAEHVYAVVTRDGVTLAPLLADLVAGEVSRPAGEGALDPADAR